MELLYQRAFRIMKGIAFSMTCGRSIIPIIIPHQAWSWSQSRSGDQGSGV